MIINSDIIQWCKDREWTNEKKFHAVLCDPPYELGFMGKSWDSTGVAFDKKTWRAVADQCYPGAYLLAFGGTRTFHRIAVAIEDAGFEIRDTLMWVYGSGFPKSHNVGKAVDKAEGNEREFVETKEAVGFQQGVGDTKILGKGALVWDRTKGTSPWEGYGTALKPSWEPIIVARLPLEGTVAQNAKKYGSGALWIDGTRVGFVSEEDRKESTEKNQHEDFGTKPMENNNVYGDYSMMKPKNFNPPGRWPANLIHDGSDEVVGMFPNTGPSKSSMRGIQAKGYSAGVEWKRAEGTDSHRDHDDLGGSAARFFYSAKVSKRERDAGLEGFEATADTAKGNGLARICETCGAPQLKPELCECPVKSWVLPKLKNHHPTLKPISLTKYLATLILPPKLEQPRRLLVPFSGAGSEVIGALQAGWDEVVGVEQSKEYVEIAEARIKHWTNSSPQSSSSSTSVLPESTDGQETSDT